MSNSGTRPIVLAARSSSPHPEVRAERASKDEGEAPQLHPSRLSAARRAPQDEVNSNRSRDAGASELRSRRSARRKSAHDPEKCCPVFGLRSCATKKGGEAPKDACHPVSAPFLPEGRGCGSDPSQTSLRSLRNLSACGTARLPALRCGACPASERQDSAQAALHAKHDAKALPPLRIALKRGTSRPGRCAGGDDARTARERGYKPRPQEPHSLHQLAVTGQRPFERARRRGYGHRGGEVKGV